MGPMVPYAVNISGIVKKKITQSFLSEKGIMINTKKNTYLINWDKIAIKEDQYKKMSV
jgi:hypothetical protein